MSCPKGTGYKASSSLTAHMTGENTCVLSQAVLTGFASGLWGYVTSLTCVSSPDLVTWERTSCNSSHAKMCTVPARATTTAWRWQKSPRSFVSYALHPGSKILEGRKGRSFLSACRQPDGPTLCRWSLAAVSSTGCRAEVQTALGKGCRRQLAQSSRLAVFFPIPCVC